MVDGGLHAAELRGLDVQHLQDIVGQRVDQVGYAGQRLGGVVLGLLQRPLLVWRLNESKETAERRVTFKQRYICILSCAKSEEGENSACLVQGHLENSV